MRRSTALNEVLKILQEWEGSQLNMSTAKELLNRLEEIGMQPPLTMMRKKKKKLELLSKWEPERKEK
jgi:hypothetical protein